MTQSLGYRGDGGWWWWWSASPHLLEYRKGGVEGTNTNPDPESHIHRGIGGWGATPPFRILFVFHMLKQVIYIFYVDMFIWADLRILLRTCHSVSFTFVNCILRGYRWWG